MTNRKSTADSPLADIKDYTIVKLVRGGKSLNAKDFSIVLEFGDEVVVEGLRSELLRVKDIKGIEIKADVHLEDAESSPQDVVVVEGVLLPHSPLLGQSLKSSEFFDRYGLQVLGLNRAGYRLGQKLSRIRMRLGDVLLLQGSPKNVKALEQGNLFSIFGGVDNVRLKTTHTVLALTIFTATLDAALSILFRFRWLRLAGRSSCWSPDAYPPKKPIGMSNGRSSFLLDRYCHWAQRWKQQEPENFWQRSSLT